IVGFAVGRLAAVEFLAVPGGHAGFAIGAVGSEGDVSLAQHAVGPQVGGRVGLNAWNGVGGVEDVGRYVGTRAVVLVVAPSFVAGGAAPGQNHGRRDASQGDQGSEGLHGASTGAWLRWRTS